MTKVVDFECFGNPIGTFRVSCSALCNIFDTSDLPTSLMDEKSEIDVQCALPMPNNIAQRVKIVDF